MPRLYFAYILVQRAKTPTFPDWNSFSDPFFTNPEIQTATDHPAGAFRDRLRPIRLLHLRTSKFHFTAGMLKKTFDRDD